MLQSKGAALTKAKARVKDLEPASFFNLIALTDNLDQVIEKTVRDMRGVVRVAREMSQQLVHNKDAAKKLLLKVSQPRRLIRTHLKKIEVWCIVEEWCRDAGETSVELLSVTSPVALLELCDAVDTVNRHATLPHNEQDELRLILRRVHHACDCVLSAQRDLDYFSRTWDAFQAGNTECPVCFEAIDIYLGNFLFCGHAICAACARRLQNNQCPVCRSKIPGLRDSAVAKNPFDRKVVPTRRMPLERLKQQGHLSSKIFKMLEVLREIHRREAGAKVLLFSQWNSLRSHVGQALRDARVKYLSLEGTIFDRSRVLQQFQSDPSISLLLLSLEDSASGTNLTVASHVFLLHPMLASSKEEATSFEAQAVGRVRRLGQTKPVHVWRFMTCGTIEESLWDSYMLQQEERT
mmetsp:Transcript_10284/g.17653  ORF Transcript_10284/g.17653 Transcript_10284/m.17653 type:complete len:407 (+) Transcript_10284:1-1221(+)